MEWIRDEFGNLHRTQHISIEPWKEQGEEKESPVFSCIHINGHCASRPYMLSIVEETMTGITCKIREGSPFVDMEEIIREVRSDFAAPLSEGMCPWPPEEAGRGDLH